LDRLVDLLGHLFLSLASGVLRLTLLPFLLLSVAFGLILNRRGPRCLHSGGANMGPRHPAIPRGLSALHHPVVLFPNERRHFRREELQRPMRSVGDRSRSGRPRTWGYCRTWSTVLFCQRRGAPYPELPPRPPPSARQDSTRPTPLSWLHRSRPACDCT